jgi:hypothetical protein
MRSINQLNLVRPCIASLGVCRRWSGIEASDAGAPSVGSVGVGRIVDGHIADTV